MLQRIHRAHVLLELARRTREYLASENARFVDGQRPSPVLGRSDRQLAVVGLLCAKERGGRDDVFPQLRIVFGSIDHPLRLAFHLRFCPAGPRPDGLSQERLASIHGRHILHVRGDGIETSRPEGLHRAVERRSSLCATHTSDHLSTETTVSVIVAINVNPSEHVHTVSFRQRVLFEMGKIDISILRSRRRTRERHTSRSKSFLNFVTVSRVAFAASDRWQLFR